MDVSFVWGLIVCGLKYYSSALKMCEVRKECRLYKKEKEKKKEHLNFSNSFPDKEEI